MPISQHLFSNYLDRGIGFEHQTEVGPFNVNTSLNAGLNRQSAEMNLQTPLQNNGVFSFRALVENGRDGLFSSQELDFKLNNNTSLGLNYDSKSGIFAIGSNLDNIDLNYAKTPNSRIFTMAAQNDNNRVFLGLEQNEDTGTKNSIFDAKYGFNKYKDDLSYYGSINSHFEGNTDFKKIEFGINGHYGTSDTTILHNFNYIEQTYDGTKNGVFFGNLGIEHNFNLPDNGIGSVSAQLETGKTWQRTPFKDTTQNVLNFKVQANIQPNDNFKININATRNQNNTKNGSIEAELDF